MKWPAVLLLAGAITTSCSDGSGPALPELHGTYVLSSKSGDPVPFPATCGNFIVESGSLTLGALGSASYELRYRGAQNDSIYSYTSAGQFAQTGAQLRLRDAAGVEQLPCCALAGWPLLGNGAWLRGLAPGRYAVDVIDREGRVLSSASATVVAGETTRLALD